MKKISLLLAFVAFFSAVSFANTAVLKENTFKGKSAIFEKDFSFSNSSNSDLALEFFKLKSCTLKVSWTNPNGSTVTLTVTASCDECTQQQACDAAYTIVSIAIPD